MGRERERLRLFDQPWFHGERTIMEKRKWLLMKAIEYNWDEMGPGDWESIEWLIFSDGSYEMVSKFNTYEETGNKTVGQMNKKVFDKLRKTLKRNEWREPSLNVFAHDGVAWEIESYREDGSIEKTSGELGYIYGHRVLETIVSLLPSDGNRYESNACVSVSRKASKTSILQKAISMLLRKALENVQR